MDVTLRERPGRLRARRSIGARRTPLRVACVVCGLEESERDARLGAWQVSRDGLQIHCPACADRLALVLDDVVLYWADCGHPGEHGQVLYDRAVCAICETDAHG
jgi:hypothetical protein